MGLCLLGMPALTFYLTPVVLKAHALQTKAHLQALGIDEQDEGDEENEDSDTKLLADSGAAEAAGQTCSGAGCDVMQQCTDTNENAVNDMSQPCHFYTLFRKLCNGE